MLDAAKGRACEPLAPAEAFALRRLVRGHVGFARMDSGSAVGVPDGAGRLVDGIDRPMGGIVGANDVIDGPIDRSEWPNDRDP